MPPPHADLNILEAALVGYLHKIQELETRIADLRSNSNGTKRADQSEVQNPVKKKRRWSAATRKRMAESQRKRWAAIKAKQAKKS